MCLSLAEWVVLRLLGPRIPVRPNIGAGVGDSLVSLVVSELLGVYEYGTGMGELEQTIFFF